MQTEKLLYFAESLWKRATFSNMSCPNCGSERSHTHDRKFVLLELRRCLDCKLMYRAPTDDVEENKKFYPVRYNEGCTTQAPSEADLEIMKTNAFAGTGKSYRYYIEFLHDLGLGARTRVFDYGCSWGYGSWQFREAGFDVTSYEISLPRANYARARLGVSCLSSLPDADALGDLAHSFDVFFSSHVLEHVPTPGKTLRLARALVKPGGFIVSFTPNGSLVHRTRRPENWHTNWGKVHPNMIDEEFYRQEMMDLPLLLAASPVERAIIKSFASESTNILAPLIGDELACVARC
jgi:2-polyprenyl-3-methyl-5-hydroxy-6-metoxy-1,4-benzoquinol methylase